VPRSRQEIIALCMEELSDVLPRVREARLVKGTVVKETQATFSPAPGSDQWRPSQKSPIAGLFLAGDWTATGWPSTMEGAVRSGYLAAEAILSEAGVPQKLCGMNFLLKVWRGSGPANPEVFKTCFQE
jgi:uncharacterized protein with NAD-binding domain and iron-sulfur cluster